MVDSNVATISRSLGTANGTARFYWRTQVFADDDSGNILFENGMLEGVIREELAHREKVVVVTDIVDNKNLMKEEAYWVLALYSTHH
jgi:hypothetical protein